MLVIAGSVQVKPERRAEAAAAALELARATVAEAGCRTYRFSAALDDPNTFLIFEEWDSEEALLAHFQTPHMAAFNAAIPAFLAAPPSITRYDVAATTKMM